MNMTTANQFYLRGFRPQGTADAGGFSAKLMLAKRIVAEIKCVVADRPAASGVHRDIEVTTVHPFLWEQFERVAAGDQDQTVGAVLKLADSAYHARRLQVMSLRHTAFRLKGDPPEQFRYLRGRPYSTETEGMLRLTYGRRLETVFQRAPGESV